MYSRPDAKEFYAKFCFHGFKLGARFQVTKNGGKCWKGACRG